MTALTGPAAEALAAELAGEMSRRWRQGERPLPEDFLARHPALWEHPEAAADVIYEELCLRQELGLEIPTEEVLRRFPQWRPQLEVLLDCQRLLAARRAAPEFPTAGEFLGDFLLLAELGRGAQGPVFLANQLSLGDRPVVLKLTHGEAREHLSLARLQHTYIVPLYSAQDYPARGFRTLVMPFFGGATLAQLLEALGPQAPARRSGQDLLAALDGVQAEAFAGVSPPLSLPFVISGGEGTVPGGPARAALARASYVQAVCWIGACLADALHYAHERGLVHLDLKPSNVLLAADAQPMLLDFHLARAPIRPGADGVLWLGGTPGYMSPEQEAAVQAVERGRKVAARVDGRSDIYSLGVVLYEALAGRRPEPTTGPSSPLRCNGQVSVGLADVVGKCLAADPGRRYPHMAALAADLRRHLANLPLHGVRNRSLRERWRKWRRRRPQGVALASMMLAVLAATAAVAIGAVLYFTQRVAQARTALNDGRVQLARGRLEGALGTLRRGLALARNTPFQDDLADQLTHELRQAEEAKNAAARVAAARELHQLTDRVRFLYGADHFAPERLRGLEIGCRALWENRKRVVEHLRQAGGSPLDPVIRDDLLDLAIFWAELQVRLESVADTTEAQGRARRVLDQAEALLGPSRVLDQERQRYGASGLVGRTFLSVLAAATDRNERPTQLAPPVVHGPERPPPGKGTAWEHYALGRALLRSGDLERAAEEVEQAVRLQPAGLWPNFYKGLCAHRQGRHADAATAFSICIGAAPQAATCFYNRALAFAALGHTDEALRDYDQALRLDPTLAAAALNRGLLHYQAGRFSAALADLQRALDHDPNLPAARKLYDRLRGRQRRIEATPPSSP